uniref:Uncharacterized protein n=1 Tax=Anguilla anguilla TaxID=7936 RepID=A0A0E9UG04_ANGAN
MSATWGPQRPSASVSEATEFLARRL